MDPYDLTGDSSRPAKSKKDLKPHEYDVRHWYMHTCTKSGTCGGIMCTCDMGGLLCVGYCNWNMWGNDKHTSMYM